MSYAIGLSLAVLLFAITYFGKHLTLSGAVLVFIIVVLFSYFGLWSQLALLLITYAILMVIDKATAIRRKPIVLSIHSKTGARTAIQILANGSAALLSASFFVATESRVFLIVFAVGVGETFTDSIASDIGVLSKRTPRDICTWKQISPGLSGGVSILGITASIAASVAFGILTYFCFRLLFAEVLIISLLSFLGCVIDSILGSRIQAQYQCEICGTYTEKRRHCEVKTKLVRGLKMIDNCAVNLISNLIVCGLCFASLCGGL